MTKDIFCKYTRYVVSRQEVQNNEKSAFKIQLKKLFLRH
ncbi:hypothetical protein T190611E02C_40238 [Tenacibaculum sp. 190524A05c]